MSDAFLNDQRCGVEGTVGASTKLRGAVEMLEDRAALHGGLSSLEERAGRLLLVLNMVWEAVLKVFLFVALLGPALQNTPEFTSTCVLGDCEPEGPGTEAAQSKDRSECDKESSYMLNAEALRSDFHQSGVAGLDFGKVCKIWGNLLEVFFFFLKKKQNKTVMTLKQVILV